MSALLAAYRHTNNNREELEASQLCGCCSCMQIFPAQDIVAWDGLEVGDFDNPESITGGTALCPHCGNDSVLGDKAGYPIDLDFLGRMSEAWFQKTIIRKPQPKL